MTLDITTHFGGNRVRGGTLQETKETAQNSEDPMAAVPHVAHGLTTMLGWPCMRAMIPTPTV